MSATSQFILMVLVLAAIGFGIWAYLRHRYIQSLEEKGWRFISSPPIDIAYGLNVPPFGVGFQRKVDDQIVGNAHDGTPFSAFEYESSEWDSMGYVVAMPLPRSLPPGVVGEVADTRVGDIGPFLEVGAHRASSQDYDYTQELVAAVGPHLRPGYRISVDHDNVVLVHAPKDADGLEAAVEQLAAVRTALLSSPVAQRPGPPAPASLSFYERPEWVYIVRDDSYLRQVNHSSGGSNHQAHDIIYSDNGGLPFLRLRHTWQTQHTRTDANGNRRTETRDHAEILCEFRTTFPFQDLSVNWGMFGRSQKFEWEEFNRRFTVRTPNPRFGSDVVHQQQMEYLMRMDAPKFQIANGAIRIGEGGHWLPADIDRASRFLHGFFGHVPDFVYQQLGAWPRPIPDSDDINPEPATGPWGLQAAGDEGAGLGALVDGDVEVGDRA